MRQPRTAFLAAAVGLALAASAGAQAASTGAPAGKPSITNLSANGTVISSSTRIPGPVNAAPTGSTSTVTTTTTTTTPQNVTTVDVRNQQTLAATAGTRAGGSTSALGTLAAGASDTSGVTVTGLGALGNGGTVSGAPILVNSSDSTLAMPATTLATATSNGVAGSDVYAGSITPFVAGDTQVATGNGASVDRAINQVSRDRKRVGRNGQLLNTIAPRTNADRSREMPDDPLPPTLTGSNSTLVR